MDDRCYSLKEFAVLLAISTSTARRMVKDGRVNAFRLTSLKRSHLRIPMSEIGRMKVFNLDEIVAITLKKPIQELPPQLPANSMDQFYQIVVRLLKERNK